MDMKRIAHAAVTRWRKKQAAQNDGKADRKPEEATLATAPTATPTAKENIKEKTLKKAATQDTARMNADIPASSKRLYKLIFNVLTENTEYYPKGGTDFRSPHGALPQHALHAGARQGHTVMAQGP